MFSKDFLSEKAIYELDKINEIEQRISRIDLIYKTGTKKKDKNISKFKTIRCFGREIYSGILTLDDALKEQISLKDEIGKFKESTKPKTQDKKKNKKLTFGNVLKAKYLQCKTRHKETDVQVCRLK